MAPIKFEEQLKDKLEERSLQPSTESWAKLSERLDAEEKKTKFPWFWWMGIAAAVLITLTIVMQTLGSKNTEQTLPQVVEQDLKEDTNKVEESATKDTKEMQLVIENSEAQTSSEQKSNKNQKEIINYKSVAKSQTKSQLAVDEKIDEVNTNNIINSKNEQKVIIEETLIDKAVVAQTLKDLNTEKTTVTDREVDSLLKAASKVLFKDKLQKEASRTVDAKSLLEDVEDDMGQSFRTKVYEVLKDGYKTVKTAVAQRND
ncbi:hypothetical protein BWZ20_11380 [Winogradskyella sp. J14-2]|uniref:hypothetical protein n=1 Tax=Winogradskyella sp. J14-2 TaxID=1936080 RepID=UPI000972D6CF|nr:hypothetical protein [Winogradskyella sp. J14-2]APY08866.1 hypothetical protein BWZ20_11380 [Winogradskyella sp. J14-2]